MGDDPNPEIVKHHVTGVTDYRVHEEVAEGGVEIYEEGTGGGIAWTHSERYRGVLLD